MYSLLAEQNQRNYRQVASIPVDIGELKNPDIILDNEGNVDISELVENIVYKYDI